jgi:hypothetical protein
MAALAASTRQSAPFTVRPSDVTGQVPSGVWWPGAEVAPVALRNAARLPGTDGTTGLPESSWYSVKRRLLGPPLVNEQLRVELLSKPFGRGVLSRDGISSANYGPGLTLHELLPFSARWRSRCCP